MNFGNNEQTFNTMIIAALVALAAIGISAVLMPHADENAEQKKINSDLKNIRFKNAGSQKKLEAAKASVDKYTWKISPDKVGPEVLTSLTKLAEKHHVTMTNFRPSKVTQAETLNLAQFDTTITGSYADASEFLREVEQPENLLTVQALQLSNSDGITDDVNVSLTLVAVVNEGKKQA